MTFYADLHIHSRFSRATSRDCNLEELARWAQRKGIAVIGTGDFTHPAWLGEMKEKLVPAEPGLFRLRSDTASTRFMLQVEISTIYKKGDRTRKVHHLIYVPDFEKADNIVQALSRIGNLKSDGRPILGLDSRHLLEITLEAGQGCYLIPAHIWTPWFSVFGSNSGFDAIEECYGDLTPHIFALETGLSSDPPMNWRLSSLDRYRLVSNSDAHSPAKLGREACVFDTEMDYFAMWKALESGKGYGGTVEFFPEEGKYHLDGHRKCGVRLSPEETRKNGGICPVCGKGVTVGVMHRVEELADRSEGTRPPGAAPFRSFVPLVEVLSEILRAGPDSRKVTDMYEVLITRLGPELFILEHAAVEDIRRVCSPVLAEGIARMRNGKVTREAGYDGEYGAIRLFEPGELAGDLGTGLLFKLPVPEMGVPATKVESVRPDNSRNSHSAKKAQVKETASALDEPAQGILGQLDPDQREAAEITDGPLLIIAGPGTGKTHTLTSRIAHLVADRGVPPEQCLAITFTRRAAAEMVERLKRLVPDKADRITVTTFHTLGYMMLREHGHLLNLPQQFHVAGDEERTKLLAESLSISRQKASRLLSEILKLKREGSNSDDAIAHALAVYQREMKRCSIVDFDDLIGLPVKLLETRTELTTLYRERYKWISVDEYQDIDEQQHQFIQLLVPQDGNLCVIGDPDQAIYGFRGSDPRIFMRFLADFPNARTVQLTKNYRSCRTIVEASMQVIEPSTLVKDRFLNARSERETRIEIHESATDKAEAEFVVHAIERLIGGSTFFSMDSGRVTAGEEQTYSFSDFAVLYRTDRQAGALCEALARSGMPFQKRSHTQLSDTPLAQALVDAMRGDKAGTCTVANRLVQAETVIKESDPQSESEVLVLVQALRPLAERSADLEGFLSELAMGVDADLWDPRADRISLLTLHASKGLEFPVVFIVGCEDGILPLRWEGSGDTDTDEERRLFFVGMTRARDRLFLCHAKRRQWMGTVREMAPSPFLCDIKEALLERSRTEYHWKRPQSTGEQLNLF